MQHSGSVLIAKRVAHELKTAKRVMCTDELARGPNVRCSWVGFRKRALRLGDHGDEVVRLQKALMELGYDIGEVDGEFGFLTRDALCQFQREHRLVVDGMVGPSVLATLFRPELKAMRQVHVAQRGERLIDIARTHGVTVEYLRRSNRLTKRHGLYEGRRLFFRNRYVIGAMGALLSGRETEFVLRRMGRHLSALGGMQFRVNDQGEIEGEWSDEGLAACQEHGVRALAVVHSWDAAGQPERALGRILRNRKARTEFMKRSRALALYPGVGGMVLDFSELHMGDGSRFTRLVEELGSVLRAKKKSLFVAVPLSPGGMTGVLQAADLDWRRLHSAVDGIILQSHRRTTWADGLPTPAQLRGRVKALCSRVPHWKVLLGVNLGARELSHGSKQTRDMTYQRAIAMAFLHGSRPTWDEQRSVLTGSYATPEPDSERRTLWIHNAKGVAERLQMIERYNLQGAFLWPLDNEDTRIWSEFPHWIKAWRHDEPK